MENLIMAGQLLLGLSLLIILHEWGHYYPAKLFKTRVEKFYLFFDAFNFSLFKKKIGETVYGIGWLPLGGYVKISGMIDESMDKEQMSGPPQPWEFRSKPAWQRLIIMLGGVTVNLILGFIIYGMIFFVWGKSIADPATFENGSHVSTLLTKHGFQEGDIILDYDNQVPKNYPDLNADIMLFGVREIKVQHQDGRIENLSVPDDITKQMLGSGERSLFSPRNFTVIDSIPAESGNKKVIAVGDSIVSVNGTAVKWYTEFAKAIGPMKDTTVNIGAYRNGELISYNVKTDEKSRIGFHARNSFGSKFKKINFNYGFFEAIPAGIKHGWRTLLLNVNSLKYVFTKEGIKNVGSFIAFAQAYGGTWDWQNFWNWTAMISIILAIMNLLPIPALDGGHVMFLLYEMISGKAPSQRFMEIAQTIGFFLLIGLIIFAISNDFRNFVFKD